MTSLKIDSFYNFLIHFHFFRFSLFVSFKIESDKLNAKKIVARAGLNLTLACPGAGEKSAPKIEKLTWKSSQTIIKFINGRPLEQNQRVSECWTWQVKLLGITYLSSNNLLFSCFVSNLALFFCSLQRSLSPKNFSLHFNPVKLIDSGEYICTINDKPGEPIDLLVQDVPEAPSRPMITGFTSRSVNLSWAQVQDPKNAPVTDFVLETR